MDAPRPLEAELPGDGSDDNGGGAAFRRQLCWRDFYLHVHYHRPENARLEHQERYRGTLAWPGEESLFSAWCAGLTGYPLVDAAMRQLRREGWMHNRARMLAACGAASVGVDPQPVFRRLHNPTLHQERYDPDGRYVRAYVPELRSVPAEHITQPWLMPREVQESAGCVIGRDYPPPIIDLREARARALARYAAAKQ